MDPRIEAVLMSRTRQITAKDLYEICPEIIPDYYRYRPETVVQLDPDLEFESFILQILP